MSEVLASGGINAAVGWLLGKEGEPPHMFSVDDCTEVGAESSYEM